MLCHPHNLFLEPCQKLRSFISICELKSIRTKGHFSKNFSLFQLFIDESVNACLYINVNNIKVDSHDCGFNKLKPKAMNTADSKRFGKPIPSALT